MAAVVTAVAGFVLGFGVLFALGQALSPFLAAPSNVVVVALGLVALQGIAFPAVTFAYLYLRGLSLDYLRIRLPSSRDLLWAGGGFAVAFVAAMVLLAAVTLLDVPTAQRADSQFLQDPQVLLFLLPVSVLLIGPGEELLFRGVVQRTLSEAFHPAVAVLGASALFAGAHVVALQGSLVGTLVVVAILFVPGTVFGAVYERSGNLVVPALAHGAYDAVLLGLVYLAVTVGPEGSALL